LTKQTIDNLQPGTLDGDSLFRTAQKINENFAEIYSHFGDGNTLSEGYKGLKGLNPGFISSSGSGAYNTRSIVSGSSAITVTNGAGVGGDVTIDMPDSGVLPSGSSATVFADQGITVDTKGRITSIATPTFLASAQAAASSASSSATTIANSLADANKLAINAEDSQYTLSDGTTTGFSALHHAAKAAADVATIGTSLSQAATHATNAGNSATAAGTSETNAATSATTATTQAGNASTSATNASNSASAAATSETNAGNSATAAATSATNAAASLASMGSNVTQAQTAATNAAASFDAFDDIFLGAKSSVPTVDNDGDALQTGALYFNTTSDKMFVRTSGGSWTAAGSAVNGTTNRQSYIATANQTTFAATYDIGYIDVYLNGIKLSSSDFTASNGTSFVLGSGASVGDQVDSIAYGAFSVANHYTKTEADALLAAKATTADLATTNTTVGTKASQADLTSLTTTVGTKAPLASPNFTGTPTIGGVNIATITSIPAGGNTVDMVASGTLANGDTVILNADGTVSSISGVAGGALSTQTFQSSNVYIGGSKGTFHSGENKVLIVYRDSGNSSHGKIVAGTVSGNTLSFGTPETFHGQYTNDMDVAYDVNANLVVVAFESTAGQYGEVRTYSLSGTSFTAQGSPTRWNSTNASGHVKIQYDPDAQGCVLFYRDISGSNYGKARYVGVSGQVIAFGSPVTFESNLVTGLQITYNTTENHHLVIYNRTSGGSTRQAYATVTLSGSTVSNQSSAVIFAGDTIGDMDLAHNPTINKVAISCSGQSLNPIAGYIVVGTPSTHAYTWTSAPSGSTRRFSDANVIDMTKITYNPDTGKFLVMYRDLTDSYKGKGVEITIDASSNVTVGSTETFFDFNNAYYYAPIYDTNADKLVVGYQDQSDGNKGKGAIIVFSSTTLTTSNFLGFSNAAYTNGQTATIQVTGNVDDAQTGLTINTTYYVQNDGTLGTSPSAIANVTAGKAIAATKILIA